MQRFAGDKAVILTASSTGTPAGRGSGVDSFGSFRFACNRLLYQVIEVFTKSMTVLLILSYIVCRVIHICTAAFIVHNVYR